MNKDGNQIIPTTVKGVFLKSVVGVVKAKKGEAGLKALEKEMIARSG